MEDALLEMDEDDEEDFNFLESSTAPRREQGPQWRYRRIDWEYDMAMLRNTKQFKSRYHMRESTFDKLVDLLREQLTVDAKQSMRSTRGNDPITAEMIVGSGLRFLGGEFTKSISWHFGVSPRTAARMVDRFLRAVDTNPAFAIKLPCTPEEFQKLADDFSAISGAFGIYDGCIGAIDGWLCCIQQPVCSAVADYFSGHYQRYGLNIQAICDAKLRFIYFAVTAPKQRSH